MVKIEQIYDEEIESQESIPENLINCKRYQNHKEATEILDNVKDSLNKIEYNLNKII